MINKQTQSFALIQLRNQSNCVLHAVCLGCGLWRVKASLCAWARLCAAAGSYPPYCSHAPLLSGVTHRQLSDGSFIISYTH